MLARAQVQRDGHLAESRLPAFLALHHAHVRAGRRRLRGCQEADHRGAPARLSPTEVQELARATAS